VVTRFILMDIEGTVSDINFVRNVLFPYSAKEMRNFVSRNKTNPTVRECLQQTGAADDESAIQQLLAWIASDTKHPALKTMQGLIWREGYESGAFRAHLYPEVVPTWTRWTSQNLRLGIYSSGSLTAQHLFFQYSEMGDVRTYLQAYFDLSTGAKRETESYKKIAAKLDLPPGQILFLSDIEEELDAAKIAGFSTALIVRGRDSIQSKHVQYHQLSDVQIN